MNTLKKHFLTTILLLTAIYSYSQKGSMEFVENKGQWDADINFTGKMFNGTFMLQPSGYKVYLYNSSEMQAYQSSFHPKVSDSNSAAAKAAPPKDSYTVHSHVYQVKFVNAAPNPQVVAEKPLNFYNNYFLGNDERKWAGNCKVYQAVVYKNIYPGIDVRYYTGEKNLKYDIIVAPGADASRIALAFEGAEGLSIKNKKLVIKTSVGDVTELDPYSYQPGVTGRATVNASYKLTGNILKFDIKDYDKTKPLIIDPSIVFSTFTGSTEDNWGYTATYDNDGNFYSGGIVFGNGFRTTPGAYQQTFQGGNGTNDGSGNHIDIGIMKFNSSGTAVVYATYLGGSGDEQPHSLVVDPSGNLVVAGRSNSSNYPASSPLIGSGGNWDIVITKLNATGTGIIGSRRIGGSGMDGVNLAPKAETYLGVGGSTLIRRNYGDDARSEVILDGAGNIYLASASQSANFPTVGAFQPAKSTNQDGVILKLSPDVSTLLFSTFLGGNGEDACFVLALHPLNNNIYVAGATTSNNFPGVGAGVISPAFQGNTDGYVSIIANNGSSLIGSTYLGNPGFDMVYGIQFDALGFPYVMGTSTTTWPVVNAAFSQPNSKQFISKLQSDLSAFVYSTNYGTNRSSPNISPVAFLVDRCENVYVSGWGGSILGGYPVNSTTGMTVTPDAFKPTTDGNDFYFIVLERNAGSMLFGSFFGQQAGRVTDHVDGGTSRFDRRGIIYMAMCANCGNDGNFPTTPGVVYPDNGSDNCNLAAVKIAFDLSGIGADLQSQVGGSSTNSGCVPLEVTFTDAFAQGVSYQWDFGDGSPQANTTVPTINHTYTAIGTYNVRLVSTDPASCNVTDTSYTTITVRNDEAALDFDFLKLAPCTAFNYQFTNTSVPPAGKPFAANSFTWDFGDGTTLVSGTQTVTHAYASAGTYVVKLNLTDPNYCNAPDVVEKTIRVSDNVRAQFTAPPFACAPATITFNNTSLAGETFFWDFGDGTTSTDVDPTHTYTIPGTYTVFLRAIDNNTCNVRDSTTKTIIISQAPVASFSYSPNPPQTNAPVVFTNTTLGGTRYKWIFGDGDTLNTIRIDTIVSHTYNETKEFNACLVAYNNFGCTDTFCLPVSAKITPIVAVPNALTPNNDGVNDRIFVRSFGISKMTWRIYNRWGKEVFSTANRTEGWDGKYQGVIQPQDVYHYVLDVEFFGGKRQQLKGDITLLR